MAVFSPAPDASGREQTDNQKLDCQRSPTLRLHPAILSHRPTSAGPAAYLLRTRPRD
jgi:hypothetical protein